MAKKTLLQKENELMTIINDAQNQLTKIQDKYKTEIGELACRHGLNAFSLDALDTSFKQLALDLKK